MLEALPPQAPVRACLDDSLLRRAGLHTPGVAWRRDPLGPRFQTNFVRAQRFLQISLALPAADGSCRLIPVAFRHAPTPAKPGKKATPAEQKQYRAQARAARLSQRAREEIHALRAALDADPASASRRLIVAFDGGYTNGTVLKHLPPNTTAIGRLRQDAHLLFRPHPSAQKARGRRLRYGPPAPTPEQVRTDDSPWETLTLTHHGISHQLRYKRRTGLMWRAAGAHQVLQLIVIAPLAYRLRKGSKLLYRQPAFLLCTDENLDPQVVIETYCPALGHRGQFPRRKNLAGRGPGAGPRSPLRRIRPRPQRRRLRLAAPRHPARLRRFARTPCCRAPSGCHPSPSARISTQQAIHQLRAEVWGRGLGLDNFSGFASTLTPCHEAGEILFPSRFSRLLR